MPNQAKVIPYRQWVNVDGRTASITGAAPFAKDAAAEGWSVKESGFTIVWPDGTRGAGRPPFATADEAQAYADKRAGFRGMSAVSD